jgi:hypothetical protein
MKWNNAPALAVLTGLFAALGAVPAYADGVPACTPPAIAADANVRRRWPDLLDVIQQAFERRGDVDACARIELTIADGAVVLKVTLPDGRTAGRSVPRREDVLPALEALLLLPAITMEAEPPRNVLPARIEATVTILPQEPPAPPADRESRLRIELGLGIEGRAGDGQMGAGVGVASFLELAHWLLGFQARIDRYQPVASRASAMVGSDSAMPSTSGSIALELDALFGRRFELGNTTLDLVAGPALAVHGSETVAVSASTAAGSSATTPAASPPADQQGLPRLLVSSRLTFRARSLLRTFVQLDGEIGRPHSSTEPRPDQAALPAWTVGLAIGATVGTR